MHDRMPVVLSKDRYDMWLDPALEDPAALAPLLAQCPRATIQVVLVSTLVNTPGHDDPRSVAAPDAEPGGLGGPPPTLGIDNRLPAPAEPCAV